MSAFRTLASEVHKLLQDTEAYAAYAAKIVRRYKRNDTIAKWTVAAAACAPFVEKLRTTSASTASWFVALVPLLAIGLPLLNFSRVIQLASELHGKHAEILPQLKKIWREISSADEYSPATAQLTEQWKKEIHDIDVRLAAIRAKKSEMPEIKSLQDEAARDCDKVKPIEFQEPRAQIDPAPSTGTADQSAAKVPDKPKKQTKEKTKETEAPKQQTVESRPSSSGQGGAAVINYQTRIDHTPGPFK
jgi:hypothetical protein